MSGHLLCCIHSFRNIEDYVTPTLNHDTRYCIFVYYLTWKQPLVCVILVHFFSKNIWGYKDTNNCQLDT